MKVLVVSNCSTPAYHAYLSAMFPDWEVRSALIDKAAEFLEEGHSGFRDYLAETDLFVGLPGAHKRLEGLLRPGAELAILPGFLFMGLRPDCIWLNGVTSPMDSGIIHSRIVAAAWWLGRGEEETTMLFTPERSAALGYATCYAAAREETLATFRAHGVELSEVFARWQAMGDFQYTPNHPAGYVFFDILHTALISRGVVSPEITARAEATRAAFPDYLAAGIRWPVYPEIAAANGVEDCVREWLAVAGKGLRFDLPEMVRRSFARFAAAPEAARASILAAFGNEEAIARYGQ